LRVVTVGTSRFSIKGTKVVTYNELVEKVAKRAGELADSKLDALRMNYPGATDTAAELKRRVKEMGLTRGQIIHHILCEEFFVEFDRDIEAE
jgi:hypothetical protein